MFESNPTVAALKGESNSTDSESQTTAPAPGDDSKNGTAAGNANPENPSTGGNETAKADGT